MVSLELLDREQCRFDRCGSDSLDKSVGHGLLDSVFGWAGGWEMEKGHALQRAEAARQESGSLRSSLAFETSRRAYPIMISNLLAIAAPSLGCKVPLAMVTCEHRNGKGLASATITRPERPTAAPPRSPAH